MKVARKKGGKILSGIVVFALAFGAVYLFTHDDVAPTFAKIEESLEDTKLMQTVDNITEPKKSNPKTDSSKKEQEIKNTTDEIKKQLEKNREERKKLERELENDRKMSKNVDEAKRRLEELEKEYEKSLEKSTDESESLGEVDNE